MFLFIFSRIIFLWRMPSLGVILTADKGYLTSINVLFHGLFIHQMWHPLTLLTCTKRHIFRVFKVDTYIVDIYYEFNLSFRHLRCIVIF